MLLTKEESMVSDVFKKSPQLLEQDKLGSINGLRGIAILMVIYQHSLASLVQTKFGITRIVGDAWIGVNLFFILSGFVLYRPYLLKQRFFSNVSDLKAFYLHRWKRLYPLFILNALVALLFAGPVSLERLQSFALTITTLSAFTDKNFMPIINIVLWSLVIEIWFSIVFPAIVLLVNRWGLLKVTLSVAALSIGIRYIGAYYDWDYVNVNPIKDSFVGRLDDFLFGMVLVHCYYRYNNFKAIGSTVQILLFVVGIVMTLLGCYLWDLRIENTLSRNMVPFLNNIIQLGFGGIVVAALKPRTLLNKIASIGVLQIIGLMCFSLYVWHTLLLWKFTLPYHFLVNYGLYLVFLTLLSATTYRFIEFGQTRDVRSLFLLRRDENRP